VAVSSGRVLDLAMGLMGSLEPREVVQRILDAALELLHADRATLSTLGTEVGRIEATAGRDGSLTWIGHEFSVDAALRQPLVAEALRTLRPAMGGPMDQASAASEFRDALQEVRHTVTVPLSNDGTAVGMLVLSRYGDPAFGDADLPALALFAALAGLALRNATLYSEASRSRSALEAAVGAAHDVGSEVELSRVLARLIDRAAGIGAADAASIVRLENGAIVLEASTRETPPGTRWDLPGDLAERLLDGALLDVGPESGPEADYVRSADSPYRRILLLPLLVGRELTGVLILVRAAADPFTEEQLAALEQLGALAGLLLRSARLLDASRAAERSKVAFMAAVAQELRSPLAVARGYLNTNLAGAAARMDEAGARAVEEVSQRMAELETVVSQLQTVAELEAGTLAVRARIVDLEALLRSAASRADSTARPLGGSVVAGPVAPGLRVRTDPPHVTSILDSLLVNALSYSAGPPRVELSLLAEGGRAVVRVRDHGPGIPADEREAVFELRVRGRSTAVRQVPGRGLGLYIARRLAERIGGGLGLEPGTAAPGSVFRLELPLEPGRGPR
jgi:signal transduction histidine kinase